MAMDTVIAALLIATAACGVGIAQRLRSRKRQGAETARHVEAERIIAMLSNKQPGVWDQEELRDRVARTARDLWSLPTRESLGQLQTWVNPVLLREANQNWPAKGDRREVSVQVTPPVGFIQVNEGGQGPDRLIARLTASLDTAWFDDRGKRIKQERKGSHTSYHTWIHIDGQGWMLDAIADTAPADEPPPFSIACRILPQGTTQETESQL